MWKNFTLPDRPKDNIIGRICFACWVTKAADTHSEYLTLIAFPRQQCLLESASVLGRTEIACIVHIRERKASYFKTERNLYTEQRDSRFLQ